MIRYLADADLNHAIVKGCRRQEPALDFLSANEAGLERVPDPEVLALAAEQNRILVTHDRQTMPHHFGEFMMKRGTSPGVFLVSQYAPIGPVIDALVLIWAASDAGEWKNRIVNIPEP
jgi:predicted nuclease of predicted toxin-antitoxin system